MLAGADSGNTYAFSQYEKMFGNAGFVKTTQHLIPDSPQHCFSRRNRKLS
jgi:hypothetical protein